MDFTFTPEQDALAETAREYLADHYPVAGIAGWAEPAPSGPAGPGTPSEWTDLAALGWLDELGVVELAILAEQAGWALYPGPWLTTVALAAPAYRQVAAQPPGPVTLAWAEPAPGPWRLSDAEQACCTAAGRGAVRLTGRKTLVPDAGRAVEVVVVAAGPEGTALYAVAAADLAPATVSRADPTRTLGALNLSQAPGRTLVHAATTPRVLAAIRRRALTLFAAEAIGVAARALDMAVRHAQVRTQFGRPIGTNQAISHRLADAYADVELARSLAYRAACCVALDEALDQAPDQARDQASTGAGQECGAADPAAEAVLVAAVAAREAAVRCCEAAIQTLGASGFSWEHPAHRWYRRARWLAGFDGFAPALRAELAGLLLDGERRLPAPQPAVDGTGKHCVSAGLLV